MNRFDSYLVSLFGFLVDVWARVAVWVAGARDLARRIVPAAIVKHDQLRAPRPGYPVVTVDWLQGVLFAPGSRFLTHSRSVPSSSATPAPAPAPASFDGDRVTAAEVKGLDGNRGLAAAVTRVHVQFAKRPPTTFILKMSRDGLYGRRSNFCTGHTRECEFYGSALSTDPRPPKPAAFYTYSSPMLGEWVMLLEDLAAIDPSSVHIGVNMVFGNQIWGIPAAAASSLAALQLDPVRVLESIYLDAADMHAAHWRQPALLQSIFLKGVPWYIDSLWARACWESSVRSAYRGWLAFKKKAEAKSDDFKFTLSPKLSAIIDASFTATSWEAMRKRLTNNLTPFTLCHGDFHAANMLLVAAQPPSSQPAQEWSVFQFDWSEVGAWQPMADLAQMMISDVKPELFPKSRDIVRKYWQRLTERGVSPNDYPWEDCWDAFCRTGVERWIWVFGVMSGMPGLPAVLIQYFHDQILKFIEAHGDHKAYAITSVVLVG